jgi:hypothetical protein
VAESNSAPWSSHRPPGNVGGALPGISTVDVTNNRPVGDEQHL